MGKANVPLEYYVECPIDDLACIVVTLSGEGDEGFSINNKEDLLEKQTSEVASQIKTSKFSRGY